jgi:hypothetical protein
MLTADQIRQRLDDAERTIATGEIDGDPHEYIEILWAQVHEEAPTNYSRRSPIACSGSAQC